VGRIGRQQREILKLLLRRSGFARTRVILSDLFTWKGKPGNVKVFDQKHIGTREYNLRHASLSRSLRRLQQMGFWEVFKSANGYVTAAGLTVAGMALARQLVEGVDGEPKLK
jgi:hypothetical protein